ncbi:sensor histidine kinase [Cohnella phaseoli]|uniref:histidine kinase n=1 Tax=Cohnella phaseoli TaxID=456490 RepID=A0A3D9JM00_9BACL|nr:histidine kinase [Cohnella phaseoli]RED75123.1 two-component system sensor histidine kinase YesM [Cohnella phaseoli]
MRIRASLAERLLLPLYSLKNRLTLVFLISTLIPLLLIGGISYYSITSLLDNKIQGSIRSNLKFVGLSLENTLRNLNYASQLLAFNGGVGASVKKYSETSDILLKSQLGQEIENNLYLVGFTNPSLGIITYYNASTNQPVFQQPEADPHSVSEDKPRLLHTDMLTIYGPHQTSNRFLDRTVLSVSRKLEVPGNEHLYVYIETGFDWIELLSAEQSGMKTAHIFVDNDRITYTELPEQFPLGTIYNPSASKGSYTKTNGYYLFEESHNQGWKMIAAIANADYYKERNIWVKRFAILTLISMTLALGLAWMIWRTVRRPLSHFNNEIKQIQNRNFHSPLQLTRITEFDLVLYQFQHMRNRIRELLQDVKITEQRKSELEIEKLLFQINPHFIHNTLDTIRWLAHSKGMIEINDLISTLNRLLYYNMGKRGESTVRQEIDALNDYVSLQKIRYDFQFKVSIRADEELMDTAVPRFILQPLVENSLYHGLKDNTVIEVSMEAVEDLLIIEVKDNGEGMDEDELNRLLDGYSDERRSVGMGIGLHYVSRTLKARFGDKTRLSITSKRGDGTSIILKFPMIYTYK